MLHVLYMASLFVAGIFAPDCRSVSLWCKHVIVSCKSLSNFKLLCVSPKYISILFCSNSCPVPISRKFLLIYASYIPNPFVLLIKTQETSMKPLPSEYNTNVTAWGVVVGAKMYWVRRIVVGYVYSTMSCALQIVGWGGGRGVWKWITREVAVRILVRTWIVVQIASCFSLTSASYFGWAAWCNYRGRAVEFRAPSTRTRVPVLRPA